MSAPIRVASVSTSLYVGGDENRLLQQVLHEDRSIVDHLLIVVLGESPEGLAASGPIRDRFHRAGVEIVELNEVAFRERSPLPRPLAKAREAWTFARVAHRVAKILRDRHIEVVDARLSLGTVVAAAAARLAGGIPVVATHYGVDHFDRRGWRAIGQLTYAGCEVVISDSQARLDEVTSWAHSRVEARHVPNGIEIPRSSRTAAEIRAELGIPPGHRVVAQIARMQPYKGQDRLIEAIPRVLERAPNTHFVICGYSQRVPKYRLGLEARISALGISDRVSLLSYPGPIADIWCVVDLHCHPTYRDSSPIALMEAMALGLPSISTDIGGIAEIVEDGVSGRVLPGDVSAPRLAEVIAEALLDPALCARWGQGARARYQRTHAPRQMATAMEAIYARIANR